MKTTKKIFLFLKEINGLIDELTQKYSNDGFIIPKKIKRFIFIGIIIIIILNIIISLSSPL